MILRVTRAIGDIGRKALEKLLLAGAFPQVRYGTDKLNCRSYSMFEYADTNARFMKVADKRIKAETGDELGIFTRKHSAGFLAQIEKIFAGITEQDVNEDFEERFHSFADDVRGYVNEKVSSGEWK